MPIFEITAPDGRIVEVSAPEGATEQEAIAYAQANWASLSAATPTPQEPSTAVSEAVAAEPWYKQAALGAVGGLAALGQGARQLAPDFMGIAPTEQELQNLKEFQAATRGTGAGLVGEFGSVLIPGAAAGSAIAKAPILAKALGTTGGGIAPNLTRIGGMMGVSGAEGAAQGLLTPVMPGSDATRAGNVLEQGLFGAAAAPAIAGVLKGVGAAREIARPLVSRAGAEVAQGKLLKGVLGENAAPVRAALETAPPGVTAGQVAAQLDETQLPALERMLGEEYGSTAALRARKAAEAGRTAALTPEDVAALEAQRTAEALPKMDTALRKADIVTRAERSLAGKAEAKDTSAVSLLQDIGKMATFGQQSTNRFKVGAPGWLSNADRAVEASSAAQDMAGIWRGLKDDALNYRKQLAALNDRGLKGIKVGEIVSDIGNMLKQPAIAASESAPALQAVMQRIASTGGDPNALYTVKKELSDIVKNTIKAADPGTASKIAASVTARITPMIDDAIDKASGGTWKDYLSTYRDISRKMDQANVMARLQTSLTAPLEGAAERRVPFANALNNQDNLISKSTGQKRYESLDELMTKEQLEAIGKVKNQLDIESKTKDAASAGTAQLRNTLKDLQHMEGVNLLDRTIYIVQSIMRRAKTGASEKTLQALATKMNDPQAIAKLMAYADADERRELAKYMTMLKGVSSGAIAANRMGASQ